ncbi:hypothetical protein P9314_24300 [Paenibacillus validus]|uniref:Uncharacterized protein n=1 Tax=Paenibacillus validus TaxID=44253 RepID=A0A7X2Z7S1_9BACL|nr:MULTISPECIES: hypothetical protein [Paenibacillus]MED4603756.1 hypothetical protein [Paenibacillus validus]MED4609230.1 hypothetical protein [Paenibacillus validus]MUG69858.1 hypothetical protein [Paenibacillus validus]
MSAIQVRDGKDVWEVRFEDIRKYHGELALMAVAVGFRSQQAAFRVLYGDSAVERKAISVVSGHAGPGFRDAFEYVTRAVSRGAYQVDTDYPRGQYDPYRPQSYAFVIKGEGAGAVEVVLKEHFLPREFYDFLKKGREGTTTEQDAEVFGRLKLELAERALALPEQELLDVRKIG